MRVVVVGGGAIGLALAEALTREDVDVTVLERGSFGAGASAGNAGWVTPGLSTPLAAPGTITQALRWLPNPNSPLWVRPTLAPSFLSWSWRFARACTTRRHRAATAALVRLGDRAIDAFARLAERGIAFERHATGLLFAGTSKAAVEHEHTLFRQQRDAGYRGRFELLDGDAAREVEPALSSRVAAALLARDEQHVRPESLMRGLVARLTAEGARLVPNARVVSLRPRAGRWQVVLADGEALEAERVVVATGADAGVLAGAGVRIPLQAAKGYSLTGPPGPRAPRRPLYLIEARVGVSPYDGAVRLAGTLELGTRDAGVNRRRVAAIAGAATRYLGGDAVRDATAWAGMRPLTPDGLPVLGEIPGRPGLFVASGHGMLGITLAPATAEALVGPVVRDARDPVLEPFSPGRFL